MMIIIYAFIIYVVIKLYVYICSLIICFFTTIYFKNRYNKKLNNKVVEQSISFNDGKKKKILRKTKNFIDGLIRYSLIKGEHINYQN